MTENKTVDAADVYAMARSLVDVSDCCCMFKCESGMSSIFDRFWLINDEGLVEVERSQWPESVVRPPYCYRIRWGLFGNGYQMSIRTKSRTFIYRVLDGKPALCHDRPHRATDQFHDPESP